MVSVSIETSVRESIDRRRARAEFMAQARASREQAQASGSYFAACDVQAELGQMLSRARASLQKHVRG